VKTHAFITALVELEEGKPIPAEWTAGFPAGTIFTADYVNSEQAKAAEMELIGQSAGLAHKRYVSLHGWPVAK